ncbi:hypothetical protein OG948_33415 [Embleya sp. NBC_00888]|uniref:hypothetical protein n=1 Tax=Embleya sp. NBC_00888 TaxID=2975960 RepID=UPI00386FCB6D|nr:hypothetical protein OG948_33415 [Embleya sp. NBC_00888]
MPEEQRFAICIGIEHFSPASPDTDGLSRLADDWDSQPWSTLPHARQMTEDLASVVESCGYTCRSVTGRSTTAQEIGEPVLDSIAGGTASDLRVVHVFSHGFRADRTGKLYVVGSDGSHHGLSDVESWLTAVEDFENSPTTLFLLDICHSGTAARYPWQLPPSEAVGRAWVIAASAPQESAVSGRFTLAVTQTLQALRDGELDVHRTYKYVPLATIAQEISRRVVTSFVDVEGTPQTVTASAVDLTADTGSPPFFANPDYGQSEWDSLKLGLDPGLVEFLDDIDPDNLLDPAHFIDRAAGRGPLHHRIRSGCFTGRRSQLATLSAWCSGESGDGSICVVTGSPGSGKSALLGILVCAAHPQLRQGSKPVWERVFGVDVRLDALSAVHARQRPMPQVVHSLCEQLGLPSAISTPARLCRAVALLQRRPAIIVDALDEAVNPVELMNELLLPLARVVRPDGSAACRVAVGMRPWADLLPLRKSAESEGILVDLDAVPAHVLRADLTKYIERLTESCLPYRDAAFGALRRAFAETVAKALTEAKPAAEDRWGEFLVAGLYTHHAIDRMARMHNAVEAVEVGARVPRTLPGVLELDLRSQRSPLPLRALVAALAFGRGNGMPLETVRRFVTAVAPDFVREHRLTTADVQEALKTVRFYLRTAPDTDASTLYRLFHQGLTDHLRAHPKADTEDVEPDLPQRILNRLLAPLPQNPDGSRTGWRAARPYTLRHAIQHAAEAGRADELLTDVEFLLHADPILLFPELDHARSPEARLSAIVYRSSATLHSMSTVRQRQQILAVDAARCHVTDFSRRISAVPVEPSQLWKPLVARAGDTDTETVELGTANTGDAYAVDITTVGGRPTVVSGHGDGSVRTWDLFTGRSLGPALRAHTDGVRSIVCAELDGRPVAVSGGADNLAHIWDLESRRQIGRPFTGHTDWIRSMAVSSLEGRTVVVTGSADNSAQVWFLDTQEQLGRPLRGHTDWIRSVACTLLHGRPTAVTVSADGTARLWDLQSQQPVGEAMRGHAGAVRAVTCSVVQGRSVVVTGGADGTLRVWDPETREPVGEPLSGHPGGVWCLTATIHDGVPLVVAGSTDGSVRTWDLDHRTLLRPPMAPHQGWVSDVAVLRTADRCYVVSSSGDGSIQAGDVDSGEAVSPQMTLHSATVNALFPACDARGHTTVLGTSDGLLRTIDVITGDCLQVSKRFAVAAPFMTKTWVGGEEMMVSADEKGVIALWDLERDRPAALAPVPRRAGLIAMTTNAHGLLVTGTREGVIDFWDLERGRPAALAPVPRRAGLIAMTTNAHGLLVTGTREGVIDFWNLERGRPAALAPVPRQARLVAMTTNAHGLLVTASMSPRSGTSTVIRAWDFFRAESVETMVVPGIVRALSITECNRITISTGWEILIFQPS